MARPTTQLFRTVQVVVLALAGLLFSLGMAKATPIDADQLIQQGFSQFYAGQFSHAISIWQQAEQQYRQQGNRMGVSGALINQSLAQQAIGQHRPACYSAAQSIQVDTKICQSQGNADTLAHRVHQSTTLLGLKALGDSLSGLGYWDEAEAVFKQALVKANQAELWHSLGALYTQSNRVADAISAYHTAMQLAKKNQQLEVLANAQIDLLGLQPVSEADVKAIDLSIFSGIFKSQAQLKIARSVCKSQPQLALQQAQSAYAIGQTWHHRRTEAEALVLIGEIRYQQGEPDIATLQQAIVLAQSIRAWDLAYPAQGLLAQIWQEQGQLDQAKNTYQAAIQNINQVRRQLKGSASRIQSDFYEQVKPIYRHYLEILFQDSARIPEIIQTSTQLQVTELENFLGCQLDDWIPIEQVKQTDSATLIFVIQGIEHYQVIVRIPGRTDYTYLVEAKALESASFNFSANVQAGSLFNVEAETISNYGKKLYEILLQPAAQHLPPQGTIAFVLDSALQNIPIDFLYDGQYYLIEQYSLSLTLGAQIRQPKAMNPQDLQVLLAGVSQVAPSFTSPLSALPQIEAEFAQIHTFLGGQVLLNQAFTIEQLQKTITAKHFPIIHLASHGTFSSDSRKTGLFAWNRTPVKVTACTISSQVGELWRHGDVLGQTSFSS
jgi:CHAT domain-containing protein/Tfp pilus assembly protein PilF